MPRRIIAIDHLPVEVPPEVETCAHEGCIAVLEDVSECDHCDHCPEHCDCPTCVGCSDRFDADDDCENCNYCPDCCTCFRCEACEHQRDGDNRCSACERCTDACCECTQCEGCDDYFPELACYECDRCNDCGCECVSNEGEEAPAASAEQRAELGADPAAEGCRCPHCRRLRERNEQPIREKHLSNGIVFRQEPTHFWDGEPTAENPSTRHASVEIEVAGAIDCTLANETLRIWRCAVVTDGSLPSHSGFEVPTAPASGGKLVELVGAVCRSLQESGAFVNESCGMHCHADARDLTPAELWRFLRLYTKVEFGLYSVAAPERWDNNYCKPCGPLWRQRIQAVYPTNPVPQYAMVDGAYGIVTIPAATTGPQADPDWLARATAGYWYTEAKEAVERFKRDARNNKSNARSYEGLNLGSHLHRGTVECRIHHGTVDPEKAVNWAVLWAGLVDAAKRMTDDEVDALPWNEPKETWSGQASWDRWDQASFDNLVRVAPTDGVRAWLKKRRKKFFKAAKGTSANRAAKPDDRGEV